MAKSQGKKPQQSEMTAAIQSAETETKVVVIPVSDDLLDSVVSVRDFAYKFAKYSDDQDTFTSWAISNIAGFPDTMSDETVAELKTGYLVRQNELHPPTLYKLEGEDTYIPWVTQIGAVQPTNTLSIGVHTALGYSTHNFGALKGKQPNLYGIIAAIRDSAIKYCNQKLRRLKAGVNASRTRSANKSFADTAKNALALLVRKNKVAKNKGDDSAVNPEKLNQAIAAFNAKLAE
jgi:hypothetical protein